MSVYQKTSTPASRSQQARLAASVKHANCDGREATAAARAASPGSEDYWLNRVDPDEKLRPRERTKRARNAKSAYFIRLGMKARKAKAEKKALRAASK